MQKILGYMRKAVQDFDLIQNGDKIAVGVSGGKDSLVLLNGLVLLRRFIGIDYDVVAVTMDPCFNGVENDYSAVQKLCDGLGVEYILERTNIGEVVFNIRKETHPCSLCAKMRRGALHEAAKQNGCNKLALGHNMDDAIETFMMNLFVEGRIGVYAPKSYLSRRDLTVIRPLGLAPEKEVRAAARRSELPIVKSKCPADGHTKREEMKNILKEQEKIDNGIKDRIFGAMRRFDLDGWASPEMKK